MSKYSTSPLLFSPILHKKVEADFDGGEITSNAGALLLRETEKQVGIISAIAAAVRDTRDLRYIDHSIADIGTGFGQPAHGQPPGKQRPPRRSGAHGLRHGG